MTESELKPIITGKLIKAFTDVYDHSLEKISNKYGINLEELKNEFKLNSSSITINLGIKKRNRRVLDQECRCMGRKFDGKQCTRSRRVNSDYCLSHEKNLPQGRIDDDNYKPKEKGKRGRKRKMNEYECDDNFIPTTILNFNNTDYLLDNNNNIYSYNINEPRHLGTYNKIENIISFKNASNQNE